MDILTKLYNGEYDPLPPRVSPAYQAAEERLSPMLDAVGAAMGAEVPEALTAAFADLEQAHGLACFRAGFRLGAGLLRGTG